MGKEQSQWIMSILSLAFLPRFGIAFFNKYSIQLCHMLGVEIAILSCVANWYCYKLLFLDIRERIFLISEVAKWNALVPDRTAVTEIKTACCLTQLTYQLSILIWHTILHSVAPIFNILLPYLKACNWSVPENLLKWLHGTLVWLSSGVLLPTVVGSKEINPILPYSKEGSLLGCIYTCYGGLNSIERQTISQTLNQLYLPLKNGIKFHLLVIEFWTNRLGTERTYLWKILFRKLASHKVVPLLSVYGVAHCDRKRVSVFLRMTLVKDERIGANSESCALVTFSNFFTISANSLEVSTSHFSLFWENNRKTSSLIFFQNPIFSDDYRENNGKTETFWHGVLQSIINWNKDSNYLLISNKVYIKKSQNIILSYS